MPAAILLLISVVLFRVAPWGGDGQTLEAIAGFSPLMAFALCAGVFFPGRWAAAFVVAASVASSVIINLKADVSVIHYSVILLAVWAAALSLAGGAVKKRASFVAVLGISLLGTVLFHIVSNTVSFFVSAGYAKTLAGWWQCQTTGLPQYPPTWLFSLRQLAGDLLFTVLFFSVLKRAVPAASATGRAVHPAHAVA